MRTKPYRLFAWVALLCTVLLGPRSVQAQEYRGTLSGRVADEQGAAVPGVSVVATHLEMGTTSTTVSDSGGLYAFPLLPPGVYSVAAELQGFQKMVRDRVTLGAGQRAVVDLKMVIGSVSETVNVTAEAALLQTGNATVGLSVQIGQIENLPMAGRAPSSLVRLSAGVSDLTNPTTNTRPFDNAGTSTFALAGGQSRTSDLLLDGGPNMARDRRVSYNPPVDIVQEVTVETFQSDAAFGNTASGTVNIVTKSGTNAFRGSAGIYTQPSDMAGVDYFTKAAGGQALPYDYKQGGFTVGGPVVIPRVVDGRNRLFWIVSYDKIRHRYPSPELTTVPTEAMRRGDFSELLPLGDIYRIYDPLTAVAEGQRRRRTPFPNNVIPANRINPIARAYLDFYPLPNIPGEANGQLNYHSSNPRSDDYYSLMGRADVNFTPNIRMMVKLHGNDRVERRNNLFGNQGTGAILPRLNSGAMIDYVHTVRPSVVLNSRLGWTRFADHEYRVSTGFDMTSLGFPASLAAASQQAVLPHITFGDSTTALGPTGGNRAGAGFDEVFDSLQWFTSLTTVRGRHSMKVGADVRWLRETLTDYEISSGQYTFGTNWTRGPLDNSAAAPHAQGFASFLLGLPTGGGFSTTTPQDVRSASGAFFFQDDWRVSPELTLNLGIRYEYEVGTTEENDGVVVDFDPDAETSITKAARAAYAANPHPDLPASEFNPRGGLVFASPARRQIYDTPRNQFSPRVGIAYTPARLKGGTVFRGGFGVFYHTNGIVGMNRPGFSQNTPFVATVDGFLRPYTTLSNPFPDGILAPVGSALGVNQNLGQAVTFYNPTLEPNYSRRYTAGFQQRLTATTMFELSYQYNQSRGLSVNDSLNFTPERFLSTSPTRDQATINRLTANVPNPFAGLLPGTTLNGATVQLQQLLTAYPHFTSVTRQGSNIGYANHHALTLTLQRRFSDGFQALATYTRQSMREAVSRLNPSDAELYYGVANEDRPNRMVLSAVYGLPFGAGRRFGSSAAPVVSAVVSNWNVSGMYTYQSGSPVTWGNVIYLGGDLNWQPRNIAAVFDVTQFNQNAAQQLSNNIRTFPPDFATARLNAVSSLNMAIYRDVPLGGAGRRTLQLRLESFNALDRVQFAGPNLTPTNANFGRITAQANTPRSFQLAARVSW